jgi:membrane associated rhomboid family serine protease
VKSEHRQLATSFIIPLLFVLVLWLIKGTEELLHTSFAHYGLWPLKPLGLIGIVTCPFLHADWAHLFANSIPLLVLGGLLFYFYRSTSWQIILLIWLVTGLWVWVFSRTDGVHIGASGLVYGIASFLFFSGIIRRDPTTMVITLLVTFLYGGMIWGIFPEFFPKERISWESHLMGLLCGLVLAWFYRDAGPPRRTYKWEEEDEEDGPDDPDAYWKHDPADPTSQQYKD